MSIVVGSLAAGMTPDEIAREYDITPDDTRAALEFANTLVEREEHPPLPKWRGMHFLIDAGLPRSIADAIRRTGHEATDVRDVGLRSADEFTIATFAKQGWVAHPLRRKGWDLDDLAVWPAYDGSYPWQPRFRSPRDV